MRVKTAQQAEKILAAAAKLFAGHRFHEARMEDVAALAEVGKGTLYRYFKDKEQLYFALLDRAAQGLQDRLAEAVQHNLSPRQQLVSVVQTLLSYFDDQPHLFDLIQHAEVMRKPGTEFRWQQARNNTLTLVKEILHAGTREGAFAVCDVETTALILLGGLRAVFRFGKQPRPACFATQFVDRFLDGFGRSPSPSNVLQVVDSPS